MKPHALGKLYGDGECILYQGDPSEYLYIVQEGQVEIAYDEDEIGGEERMLLRFAPHMAPIKAAVFPLVKREGMPEMARHIVDELRRRAWNVIYDQGGSIGRRYRRMDEVGTPFCITVDGESAEDQKVTVRDRDTMVQERIAIDSLVPWLAERLEPRE